MMTTKQRAARVWATQGQAAAMIETMTDSELERLAELVDENGNQVANFHSHFLQFHRDYYEARKAAADDPEPMSEVDHAP